LSPRRTDIDGEQILKENNEKTGRLEKMVHTFPFLISSTDGIKPSLNNSEALETTGSFCMLHCNIIGDIKIMHQTGLLITLQQLRPCRL